MTVKLLNELARYNPEIRISEEEAETLSSIQNKFSDLIKFIFDICPDSADRTAALRALRVACKQLHDSIIFEG